MMQRHVGRSRVNGVGDIFGMREVEGGWRKKEDDDDDEVVGGVRSRNP